MKQFKMYFKDVVLTGLFFVILLLFGCKNDTEKNPTVEPGKLIRFELIDHLQIEQIDSIRTHTLTSFLETASMKANEYRELLLKPNNSVKLYRITYHSIIPELENKPTIATGLIAIPDLDSKQMPLISYQHGTVFYKEMVPSVYHYSDETKMMALQFASQGYVMIASDYFGLGNVSPEKNTYFVKNSTEQACLDMYRASLDVLAQLEISVTNFYINGWSQGAYNTMLFLRRLEKENIPVKATFTAAAPVDPQLFITRGLFAPRPFDAEYTVAALCNLILSLENYSELKGISQKYIKPEYLKIAQEFYQFKTDYPTFMSVVPKDPHQAFTETFFKDAKNADAPFWKLLSDSEAYRWFSNTPLMAFYGMRDEAVPNYIATLAVDYMTTIGKTNAQTINAGEQADHRNTYIKSLIDGKKWIESLE
jgi:pimeloyl-ACP methyl ester carboxylesterase